ncbi:hypothetical protein BB559_006378 [Furculomyces boomerangus]|uniref:Uncharacterized protein n=1 Tax=Furculomyces boomerangus TaxID=61424 RepID=A0A2T9Y3E2_9FUNG|nr:hypothetical protein BB559_006378 [Furculomyces boomerangus]
MNGTDTHSNLFGHSTSVSKNYDSELNSYEYSQNPDLLSKINKENSIEGSKSSTYSEIKNVTESFYFEVKRNSVETHALDIDESTKDQINTEIRYPSSTFKSKDFDKSLIKSEYSLKNIKKFNNPIRTPKKKYHKLKQFFLNAKKQSLVKIDNTKPHKPSSFKTKVQATVHHLSSNKNTNPKEIKRYRKSYVNHWWRNFLLIFVALLCLIGSAIFVFIIIFFPKLMLNAMSSARITVNSFKIIPPEIYTLNNNILQKRAERTSFGNITYMTKSQSSGTFNISDYLYNGSYKASFWGIITNNAPLYIDIKILEPIKMCWNGYYIGKVINTQNFYIEPGTTKWSMLVVDIKLSLLYNPTNITNYNSTSKSSLLNTSKSNTRNTDKLKTKTQMLSAKNPNENMVSSTKSELEHRTINVKRNDKTSLETNSQKQIVKTFRYENTKPTFSKPTIISKENQTETLVNNDNVGELTKFFGFLDSAKSGKISNVTWTFTARVSSLGLSTILNFNKTISFSCKHKYDCLLF